MIYHGVVPGLGFLFFFFNETERVKVNQIR